MKENPINGLERAFDRLMRLIEAIIGYALIFAIGLNFANVVDRYVIGRSILGADEVEVFIMVGITFLGAAVVAWRKKHLRMDVLAKLFPVPVQIFLRAAEIVLLASLTGVVAVESWSYTVQMFRLGVTSNTAGLAMWIPHGTVMVGFSLMALAVIVRGLLSLRGKKGSDLPESDNGMGLKP